MKALRGSDLSSFFRVRNGCLHFLREDAFPFGYVGLGDDRHADRSCPARIVATTLAIRRALNQSQGGDPACLSLVQCEEAWNHSGGPAIAELPSRQCPGAWPTAPGDTGLAHGNRSMVYLSKIQRLDTDLQDHLPIVILR